MLKPMIIVAGPTAVGKTELALRLSEDLATPIISADSMQIYKGLNIGTAKPDQEQQQRATHLLIDLIEPDREFSVADYQQQFQQTVAKLDEAGKIPLIVGGTGLYIRAVTQSFALPAIAEPNPELREALKQLAKVEGNEALHRQLAEIDPEAAARIHPNDIFRVIRGLEVFQQTGIPISKMQTKGELKRPLIYLFLNRDRAELYQRINLRVDQMIADGLVEEVQQLFAQGYDSRLKSLQSLGYKQIGAYLLGQISWSEAIEAIKQKTRNYAKRQISWFKREPVDLWVNLSEKKLEFYGVILKDIKGRIDLNAE